VVQEIECQAAKKVLSSIVGYDINSQHTVVGSNGWYVKNPKSFQQSKEKLGQLQRQLARRKKGSGRWNKTKQRINTLNGKVSSRRLAFAHEVSCWIANSSDIIVFENLNVKAMQQFNGSMVNDNVMGLITQLSKYKAELRGKIYHEIGRFEKSSGICASCDHPHKLSLSQRIFACHQCGTIQCRDWSAAISVASSGETELIAGGIVARVNPNAQQKAANQTKVFERSTFAAGTDKKEAA
jgi:putative transposase